MIMIQLCAQNRFPGRLTLLAALVAGLGACVPALAEPGNVVISQVYGGAASGSSSTSYNRDFIELFNRSAGAVSLGGMSVQYQSATGASWQATALPNVTLQPGQYFLVVEGKGDVGADPGTADASGGIAMSATSGKVALARIATAMTTADGGTNVVDLLGYGTANRAEGTAAASPSISTSLQRAGLGCTDSDNNASDFSVVASTAPRNSGSPLNACSGGPQPIVASCPPSVATRQGSATSAALSARDADSTVNAAAITSTPVDGIRLAGFSPASGSGANAAVTLSVDATLARGTYPVVVQFSNNDTQSISCHVSVSVVAERTIPQIQGSGGTSPDIGTVQTTTGVITLKVSSGFFIQDPNGDGDPTTSDALFVFGGSTAAVPGDLVRVTGTVTEYSPSGATRSYTELKDTTEIVRLGSGYTVTPTNIALQDNDLARYEAMLVRFSSPLTVNQNAFLGGRGELVLASGRREVPTNRYRPGTPEAVALAAANARNMVVLDDGIFVVPPHIPYLAADGTVRNGDTVTDLVGVLDFGPIGGGGAWYKLQPAQPPVFTRSNPRTDAPVVAAGNVKVASANVLNFFTTFTNGNDAFGGIGQGCTLGSTTRASNCRGADNMAEFVRQRDKIVNALKAINADAVGLMELQNNGDIAVSYLVDQLNAALGHTAYAYVPAPAATGTDAIRVSMIYKPAVLSLVGGALSDGDSINNRPPMAQAFKLTANGARFSLVVNHFKSKSGCAGAGSGDTDSRDGQGCWNATRVRQAQRLSSYFIPQVVAAAGDPDVLVVGDLNAHGFEDPIAALTANGMVNEIERFVRPRGIAYSYVFDGESGYLDHALASTSLDPQVADVSEWHNNADEPDAIGYNLGDTADDVYVNNAYRASDHDPVVVSLNLAPAFVDVTSRVSIVRSGVVTNRVTLKTSGRVTITNTSGTALNGPLHLRLDGLTAGVTLDNASGNQGGAPYLTLPNASLAAGASVTVTVTFSNPSRGGVGFKSTLIQGTF
jgi:predicted extracellular nuclease